MLASAESSTDEEIIESIPISNPHYLVFWDMDDTLIDTKHQIIKNPHLLLPILLYQTVTQNQEWLILTNRSSDENAMSNEEHFYATTTLKKDLSKFGISWHHPVMFGMGQGSYNGQQEREELEGAIEVLRRNFAALSMSKGQSNLLSLFAQGLTDPFEAIQESFYDSRYKGKNYAIQAFLKEHATHDEASVKLAKTTSLKKDLYIGMIDDNEAIGGEEILSPLGDNFFGIKAARGGNPPKTESDDEDDYYSDAYLIHVGKLIGLHQFAKAVFTTKERHHPMQMMATVLYAWHQQEMVEHLEANQINLLLIFEELLNDFDAQSWLQVKSLLKYLHKIEQDDNLPPLENKAKHFRSTQPLLKHMQELNIEREMLLLAKAKQEYNALTSINQAYASRSHSPSFVDGSYKQVTKSPKSKKFSLKRTKKKPPSPDADDQLSTLNRETIDMHAQVEELLDHESAQIRNLASDLLEVKKAPEPITPLRRRSNAVVDSGIPPYFKPKKSSPAKTRSPKYRK